MLPGEKTDMKIAEFAHYSLDIYLPKLIRAGARVAICDRLEDPKQKKSEKESTTLSNNKDMTKKSKKQAKQEEPAPAVKNTVKEKPAKEQKTKAKAETKAETKAGAKAEAKETAKQERKLREPQMTTANGEKVTHGHAYQSKSNPEEWYLPPKWTASSLNHSGWMQQTLPPTRKKK